MPYHSIKTHQINKLYKALAPYRAVWVQSYYYTTKHLGLKV